MKNIFQIKNSSVKKNFLSLSILQISNYVFPLITLPYISRIFGPETYGLLNFATAFLSYFWLLVNYGFDLSASREIAQNRNNHEKMQAIFNQVLFSKLFLFLISTIMFVIALFAIEKVNNYSTLYLIMFFGGVFNIFFPTWFFQGIEKLNLTAIFTFIIRLIFTLIIFILIKEKNDYILYPIATILGQILISFISMYLILKDYMIKLKMPDFSEILNTLKTSKQVFFTTVVINLYTTTNFVILGFLSGNFEVGVYTAAYKIVIIFMSIISAPLSQSIYPNIGYSFSLSYDIGISKIYKSLIFIIPLTLMPAFFMIFFPELIIKLIFGEGFLDSVLTLKLLSFIPLIIGLSNIFGIQGLLNLKKDNVVLIITTLGALLGLILNFVLVPMYRHNGTAVSWVITEVFITTLMFFAFVKSTNFLSDIS
ncbi:MAG: flippase, partial [Ignavibacteria bacterium]|nr:flippase [Ignavibacteria bacterium]